MRIPRPILGLRLLSVPDYGRRVWPNPLTRTGPAAISGSEFFAHARPPRRRRVAARRARTVLPSASARRFPSPWSGLTVNSAHTLPWRCGIPTRIAGGSIWATNISRRSVAAMMLVRPRCRRPQIETACRAATNTRRAAALFGKRRDLFPCGHLAYSAVCSSTSRRRRGRLPCFKLVESAASVGEAFPFRPGLAEKLKFTLRALACAQCAIVVSG